jgi:hypothetical protein
LIAIAVTSSTGESKTRAATDPQRSNPRLMRREEWVTEKRRIPSSVIPWRWSISTDEPATREASGSTLTLTP